MTKKILIFSAIALLFIIGCEEIEIPVISDEDQLLSYLENTEEGVELFRIDSLFDETLYSVPFDNALYKDVFQSNRRNVNITIGDVSEIENIGFVREAIAIVEDFYTVKTFRYTGNDTTSGESTRSIIRYAYFLKLGDDSRAFLGWKMYGFNSLGLIPAPVTIEGKSTDNSVQFDGDSRSYRNRTVGFNLPYIKLEDFPLIEKGMKLEIKAERTAPTAEYHIISAESDKGFLTYPMKYINGTNSIDTVSTPSNNNRLWNIITIQSFDGTLPAGQHIRTWCIPYRVNLQ